MDFFKKAVDTLQDFQESHNRPKNEEHQRYQQEQQPQQQYQQQDQYQQQNQYQQQQQQPQSQFHAQAQAPIQDAHDDDPGFHLPKELLGVIDKYVDTFQPGIAAGVAAEIVEFEKATIEALEQHIKQAIKGIFTGDFSEFQSNKNMNEFRAVREAPGDPSISTQQQQYGANLPQYNYPDPSTVASRGGSANLPEYGSRGLPFAGGGGNAASHQAQVLSSNNQNAEPEPQHQRNIFESALSKVKNFAEDAADDIADGVEAQVKKATMEIADLADHLDDKLEQIVPDLKEKIGHVLQELHMGLAELMTGAALTQVKRFLAGNISIEELASSAVHGVQELISAFTDKDDDNRQRGQQEGPDGAVGLLSDKMGHGLTKIRNNSRGDFRKFLSSIEEKLFDALPDGLRVILEKLFGGNPFDPNANNGQAAQVRPEKEGIFHEIGDKIKDILERIQNALRDRVLEIVGGGHRRLEDKAWGNVQDAIVGKVRQYVPGVQVQLEDVPQGQ